MSVTQTFIPSDGTTEIERFAADAHRRAIEPRPRPVVNERPTKIERKSTIDIRPAAALIKQLRASTANALAKKQELEDKHARLTATEDRYSTLSEEQTAVTTRIRDREAKALLADTQADNTELREKLAAINSELEKWSPSIESTRRAKSMVESRMLANSEHLRSLGKELAAAEQRWLTIYHGQLAEDFRQELHNLHRIIAKMLAVEASANFERHRAVAWGFVENISNGIRYADPLRPDWSNSHKPAAFPGYADAHQALSLKLASVDGDE
ncbi:hypothetical protein GR215_23250 [Rhizobium leguminosarum]|uniref:hypothetical protein n=1 Tax=Rhizobium leguminosarum TaxID=384 RepID=UPI0013B72909|nr:hypothetical protein [Rhizobium leguminosarum]NEH44766.1 hypothetical protein [Rhizobium leguminosarum]